MSTPRTAPAWKSTVRTAPRLWRRKRAFCRTSSTRRQNCWASFAHALVCAAALSAVVVATSLGDEPVPAADEQAELDRELRAQRLAVDAIFQSSNGPDALLDAVGMAFDEKQYNRSAHAYEKLIDYFEHRDLTPLLRAYQRSESVEARIWFAAAADYCDNPELLKMLSVEVKTRLKDESRVRAAIAVAFKLGDPSMVPYLIDALPSQSLLWIDFPDKAGPSAAFMLTELTNQFFGDYPDAIMNFNMAPPVGPYPMVFQSQSYVETALSVQQPWRKWWEANKSRSQQQWILDGLKRDVMQFRFFAATPNQLDEKVVDRLEAFLDVDIALANKPAKALEQAWEAAQRDYTIPARLTK